MSRQTMRWGPEVHHDILICVFQHINFSSADFAKIMADLGAMGYTFSESALRQHIQKLRKNRHLGDFSNAGASEGGTPVKKTPSKAAAPRQRKTPSKRGKRELSPVDDEEEVKNLKNEASDEEQELKQSHFKRMKREKNEPAPFAGEAVFDDLHEI